MSPTRKDNYTWDEEVWTIFYTSYSKSLLGGASVEIYDISPYSSPN